MNKKPTDPMAKPLLVYSQPACGGKLTMTLIPGKPGGRSTVTKAMRKEYEAKRRAELEALSKKRKARAS